MCTLIFFVASKPSNWLSSSNIVLCTSESPPLPDSIREEPMESISSMKIMEGACSLKEVTFYENNIKKLVVLYRKILVELWHTFLLLLLLPHKGEGDTILWVYVNIEMQASILNRYVTEDMYMKGKLCRNVEKSNFSMELSSSCKNDA